MDGRQARALEAWIEGLPEEAVRRYYLLLDELCRGLDISRQQQFGFLRLRAEFETSGEIFGCTLEELRDRIAAHIPREARSDRRPRSPLEALRDEIRSRGHPDLR